MPLSNLPTTEDALGSVADNTDTIAANDINSLRRYIEALALTKPRLFGTSPNQISIDPDNARIEYTGTARPTELIPLPFANVLASTSATSFDGGGAEQVCYVEAAVGADAVDLRGVRTRSVVIPWWVDTADTIELVAMWQPTTIGTTSEVCVFSSKYDRCRVGDSTPIAEGTSLVNVSAEVAVAYEQKLGVFGSYAASTFAVGDLVAFIYYRDGTHASDTFSGGAATVRIAYDAFLRVRRKYA